MQGTRAVTADKLNDVMSIDHVIRVWPDGSISEPSDKPWAPDVTDNGEAVSDPWSLMTGYSQQWRYSGPCMHASEFIGGGMARDILEQPGWYVALVAEADQCSEAGCEECDPHNYTRNDESKCPVDCDLCGSDEPAGWVVAYIEADCEGHEPEPGSNGPMGGDTVYCDSSCRIAP
jgi:hypothetical protein